MSYSLVQGQCTMTFDARRNDAYAQAMKRFITPDSIVLDLGSGLGIHGLLAAQMGAKRVYLVEPEDVISVAEEIAHCNGLSEKIVCLQGCIEDIELPEKVDLIISVFTGNFLLEEDLLPSLFYARDKYLKPGGALIPEAATMEAVPIYAPELYQEEIEPWSKSHHGLDYEPARSYASHSVYYRRNELKKSHYIAEPKALLSLNFHENSDTYCDVKVLYSATETTVCHGIAGWFKMKLGDIWLSTAPHEPPLHWSTAFLPLDPPIQVELGEEIFFSIQRPPQGDWTWQVKTEHHHQQKSTFFGQPMTMKTIQKLSAQYCPEISFKGKAAQYVLSNFDGTSSSSLLGEELMSRFPTLFKNLNEAFKFVQTLATRYS
jgi:predicted RNA methylase